MAATDEEQRRNRLLRRADWRFLLATPNPGRSVCFAAGSLARATAYISGCVVERAMATGDCDLAVGIDPDARTLRAARDALRPGGSLYTEWYSPLGGGSKTIHRRLEAAGFTDVACYWAWPRPRSRSPRFWASLDAPAGLRYMLGQQAAPRTMLQRLHGVMRAAIKHAVVRTGLALPICAVSRKPMAPPAGPDFQGELLATVKGGWNRWGFGGEPADPSWLFITRGSRSINKVVGVLFTGEEVHPRLVVKIPRTSEASSLLVREAETLQAVHASQNGGVRAVPRVLFRGVHAGVLTLGETALTGVPLGDLVRRETYRDLALRATDWLSDLATTPTPFPQAEWWNRLGEPAVLQFQESFGPVVDSGKVQETVNILKDLGPLPVVCEQRDFSPWNVLVSREGDLIVLDWESAELRGLPALDLTYFLTYLAFFLDGAMRSKRFRESFRSTADANTFTGRVQRECFDQYEVRTGVDATALYSLRLLTWLIHSRSEYLQLVAETGRPPAVEALRGSLFVSLWEEELRLLGRRRGD